MGGLVVVSDTDPLNLQRRAAALENAGCRVTARALGEPLLTLLGDGAISASPDAILLGADVAALDPKICAAVRNSASVPIVVVSPRAEAPLAAVERALSAGADDVLLAPSPSALNRRIAMWRRAELRGALDERRRAALANAAAIQVAGVLDAKDLDAVVAVDIPDGDDPLAAMLAETERSAPAVAPPGRKPSRVAAGAPPAQSAPKPDTRRDWAAERDAAAEPSAPARRSGASLIERLKAEKDEQTERVWG